MTHRAAGDEDDRSEGHPAQDEQPHDDGLPDPHHITRPVELVLGTLLLAGALVLLVWLPDAQAVRLPVPGWVLGVLLLAGAGWRYAIAWRAGRD